MSINLKQNKTISSQIRIALTLKLHIVPMWQKHKIWQSNISGRNWTSV